MKTFKIITALAIVSMACSNLHAQQNRLAFDINYTFTFPTASFEDFVGKRSCRGWTANLLYGINDHLSVGAGAGFHDFYKKFPRAVYNLKEGAEISAVMTNSIQTIPVLASVKYNFSPSGQVQPYIGAGVGGNIIMYRQYLGKFSKAQSDIGVGLRPEAGVFIPFGNHDYGININGIYNYMPYTKSGMDNLNSWGVGLGGKIPLR